MDKTAERRRADIANKQTLTFRFHNPNSPEATANFLVKLFVEVNLPKAEASVRAAAGGESKKKPEDICSRL